MHTKITHSLYLIFDYIISNSFNYLLLVNVRRSLLASFILIIDSLTVRFQKFQLQMLLIYNITQANHIINGVYYFQDPPWVFIIISSYYQQLRLAPLPWDQLLIQYSWTTIQLSPSSPSSLLSFWETPISAVPIKDSVAVSEDLEEDSGKFLLLSDLWWFCGEFWLYVGIVFRSFGPSAPPPTIDPATLTCGQPPNFCPKSRYRSFDGSCNNLNNPGLGIPQTPYGRLLPPKYGDGKFLK